MKLRIAAFSLVLTLLFVCAAAFAQETYDPNAGPAVDKTAPTDELSKDERLSVKITYSKKQTQIRIILSELSEEHNVTLRAGTNSQDWQVRDRKLNISAKDASLCEVMHSISRVSGFKWLIEGTKEVPVYRLVWDANSRRELAAYKELLEAAQLEMLAQKRENALETLAGLDNLSPEALAKLRAENPFLFYLAASGFGSKFNGFLKSSPEIHNALRTGRTITVRGSELSPAAKGHFESIANQAYATEAKLRGIEPRSGAGTINVNDSIITVNPELPGGNENIRRRLRMAGSEDLLGGVWIRSGKNVAAVPLVDHNNSMVKTAGKMMIEADMLNRPIMEVAMENMSEIGSYLRQNINKQSTGGDANRIKTYVDGQLVVTEIPDELLDSTVNIDLSEPNLPELQAKITEATGAAVVSDFFPSPAAGAFVRAAGMLGAMPSQLSKKETTLRKVLDEIARMHEYEWNKPSEPIEFRDSTWYDKVDVLVPDAMIEGLKDTLTKTGTLTITEMATLARLTPEQYLTNIQTDDVLGKLNLHTVLLNNYQILGLFGVLSRSQTNAAFSRAGLNLRTLQGEAAAYVEQNFVSSTVFFANTDEPLILNAVNVEQNGAKFVDVKMGTPDGDAHPLTWRIPMPKYTPPAK